jgi:hypothetical protein
MASGLAASAIRGHRPQFLIPTDRDVTTPEKRGDPAGRISLQQQFLNVVAFFW